MFFIIGVFLSLVGIWAHAIFSKYGDTADAFMGTIFTILISVMLFLPVQMVTGGLIDDYSYGTRTGYITKLSESGVIWKTWDGELQLGSGTMASLQKPFSFSVTDEDIQKSIMTVIDEGSRVTLTYKQWFILNYKQGKTSYIVTDIEVQLVNERRSILNLYKVSK